MNCPTIFMESLRLTHSLTHTHTHIPAYIITPLIISFLSIPHDRHSDEVLSKRLSVWLFSSAMGSHRLSASAAGMAIRYIRGSEIAEGNLVDRHWSAEELEQLAGNRFVSEA